MREMRAIVDSDTEGVGLYIDTTDNKMELETWEKLGIYKFQDQLDFKNYLIDNNVECNFEIPPKINCLKLH